MADCLSQIPGCTKQSQICSALLPPGYRNKLQTLNNKASRSEFHAAFVCSKVWGKRATIYYTFSPSSVASNVCYVEEKTSVKPPKGITFNKVLNENSDPLAIEYSRKWIKATNNKDRLQIQKEAVIAVINRYKSLLSLNFKYTSDFNLADIRILINNDNNSWSYIGTDSKLLVTKTQESMNLGWFDVGSIIHEFGHAFGMIHEHQNPIGGKAIQFDEEKVYKYFNCINGWTREETFDNIIKPVDETTLNGSCFDPLSIMLYEYPSCLTKNNLGTGYNQRLSAFDALWLYNFYGKDNVSVKDWYDNIYGFSSFETSLDTSRQLRSKYYKGSDCYYDVYNKPYAMKLLDKDLNNQKFKFIKWDPFTKTMNISTSTLRYGDNVRIQAIPTVPNKTCFFNTKYLGANISGNCNEIILEEYEPINRAATFWKIKSPSGIPDLLPIRKGEPLSFILNGDSDYCLTGFEKGTLTLMLNDDKYYYGVEGNWGVKYLKKPVGNKECQWKLQIENER